MTQPAGKRGALGASRTIWIDLENSPHVLFFMPFIGWLKDRGHRVLLTARDQSQTLALLKLHGLRAAAVGDHAAGGDLGKAMRSFRRAWALRKHLAGHRIDLAMGHGSRAQVLAAASMRVPALTFTDYEYVSLRVYGLFARQVYFPDSVSREVLRRRGIPGSKLVSYPGFKEQVYIDPEFERVRPVSPPLIVVRPPARQAHYHTELSEVLYRRLLSRLIEEAREAQVLLLPRYRQDEEELRALAARFPHCRVPDDVLDGRDLLVQASLVVSGGGTMVREAAVLGIPAASYFGGPVGGVDQALSRAGRLWLLRSEADVNALRLPNGSDGNARAETMTALPASRLTRDFLREHVTRWLK
jgi:uncharacterized protein